MATVDSSNSAPGSISRPRASELFEGLIRELTTTRALIDGAYALVDTAEPTNGDESLCHSRTLLDQSRLKLTTIYEGIESARFAANRQGSADPLPAESDAPSQLDKQESEFCQRAGAVHSILVAGLGLIRKHDNDQAHNEIFQGCEAIEGGMALLETLSGDLAGLAHMRQRGNGRANMERANG